MQKMHKKTDCRKAVRKVKKIGDGSVTVGALLGDTPEKEESLKPVGALGFFVELLARFELATSSLPRMRSTG